MPFVQKLDYNIYPTLLQKNRVIRGTEIAMKIMKCFVKLTQAERLYQTIYSFVWCNQTISEAMGYDIEPNLDVCAHPNVCIIYLLCYSFNFK